MFEFIWLGWAITFFAVWYFFSRSTASEKQLAFSVDWLIAGMLSYLLSILAMLDPSSIAAVAIIDFVSCVIGLLYVLKLWNQKSNNEVLREV
jgi:FtsH-binding integral membrane protein